jgi:peptide/nickel transport system permease protein
VAEAAARVEPDAATEQRDRRRREIRQFWAGYRSAPGAVIGLVLLLAAILIAIAAPLLSPHAPTALQPGTLRPPGAEFLLGTDQVGRDILSNLIYGTRISLIFALGVAGVSLVIGVALGALAGYFGGWVDDLTSRVIEVFLMIPQFVLVITVVALFGNSIAHTIVIVGLTIWPSTARLMRAQVLTLKRRAFVRAIEASGASPWRILFRHILPNGMQPVVANSTLQMGYAILFEASISFFGLGDPNVVSWGKMLFLANLHKSAWWMAVFPGICILVLVLAFNLVGDGTNAALNPRLRRHDA